MSTANAVVVPPGILSPITRQSVDLEIDFPIILPYSTALRTWSCVNADDAEIFFPIGRLESNDDTLGKTLLPALIIKWGIFAAFNATLVSKAGVGFPSGDIGMESMHLHLP